MSAGVYEELRRARAAAERQWNWGGGADLTRALEREAAAERRVREYEAQHGRPKPLTWPNR